MDRPNLNETPTIKFLSLLVIHNSKIQKSELREQETIDTKHTE